MKRQEAISSTGFSLCGPVWTKFKNRQARRGGPVLLMAEYSANIETVIYFFPPHTHQSASE